nr:phospholipase-like protein [Tanacetum cinerariifolium]
MRESPFLHSKLFIFDIDGRTLEFGREDFYLITSFWFGKVNVDSKEEDHSEFYKRVFPKIDNLKGEHLLAHINKDVKLNKLDDEDAIHVYFLLALDFVFMGHELRHVITNLIVNLVDDFYNWDAFSWGEYMWSFFHKRDYNVVVDRRKYHLKKLASNPKYEANYVLYNFVFPLKIWALETFSNSILLRSTTRGSGNSKSVHTRVRTEVRHEVHVRTKVSRVVDKEEVHVLDVDKEYVHTQSVDEEDKKKRVVLAKTVKAQEQMIVDLQHRLLSLEEITKQLKTGPSDVDHHDKIDNRSENVRVGGLDHQSMEGVIQCMNVDEPCMNWDDALDNFHVDGLDHQSVKGVSQCTRLNDEYESVAIDSLISLRSHDVGHISKKSFVVDDPNFKVKDNEEASHSDCFLSAQQARELLNDIFDTPLIGLDSVQDACVSELINVDQPSLVNNVLDDVHIDSVVKDVDENDVKTVEAMVSPYLSDMLLWFKYSLYYIDSVKYGVPWFANNVEKVYFPINEKDSHQVLEELHIISSLKTIYDSLGGPLGGIETRHFWLELREKL